MFWIKIKSKSYIIIEYSIFNLSQQSLAQLQFNRFKF